MKRGLLLRRVGAALSLCSVFADPRMVHAQSPAEPVAGVVAADFIDVVADNGMLLGEVRDQQGRQLAGRQVRVFFQGNEVASTTSGANGTFRISGIREGVHEVHCCNQVANVRVWPRETAPPQSDAVVVIVCDEYAAPVARQVAAPRPAGRGGFLVRAFATYPVATTALLAAGIGTAIAVPIATSQSPSSP